VVAVGKASCRATQKKENFTDYHPQAVGKGFADKKKKKNKPLSTTT
jgi:hypothetical protein